LFSFTWPSVPYALDILAWDLFFELSMLFAAAVFSGDRFQMSIRILMIVSGVLALAGMSGVVDGASEKIADNSTRMNPPIRDFYGHRVWADAEHWRAIDRSPPARGG
jgi:ABC-type lipoprotein release transport system permease subunit